MKKLASFIKENRTGFKVVSMILVLALMVQTVSIAVTAIEELDLSIDEMVSIDNSSETMPSIVGEVESKRDQHTKVYELADGSFYEVISNEPIHKNVDGQWEEPTNNLDHPETIDEVTSYCNELIDSISEEQNNGGISTFSYIEDDSEPYFLSSVYIAKEYVDYESDPMLLEENTRLLLRIDDERLSLSNSNQLLLNQTLYIECQEMCTGYDDATLLVKAVSDE